GTRRRRRGRAIPVAALPLAPPTPATRNQTYVVADPAPLTIAEIVAALRAGQGRRPGLVPVPPLVLAGPLRALGRASLWERLGGNSVVDPGQLLAGGGRPPTDTRAGLAAMVQAASPPKSGTASRSTL